MGKVIKTILKIVGILLLVIVITFAGYFAYLFTAYHRMGDLSVTPKGTAAKTQISTGVEYKMASFNIGFGAYESDYGFFMDGGTQSWAWSEERLDKNLKNIAQTLADLNADIYHLQEVDKYATRTYHVDERKYFTEKLTDMSYFYAPNFDSPFIAYPFTQPHGANKSGIMTYSAFEISDTMRYELPVESGITKIVDLDRAYSKCYIAVEGGKKLVLYNFHLSAYTTDGPIATEQLKKILADMKGEYDKGNYCIAGGDFNKDLLGDSSVYFGKGDKEYNWAQPIPAETFDGYGMVTLVAPLNGSESGTPVPTCRNADSAYHAGQFVVSIDGFMITSNVKMIQTSVIDTGFAYSDHNPVQMSFKLL